MNRYTDTEHALIEDIGSLQRRLEFWQQEAYRWQEAHEAMGNAWESGRSEGHRQGLKAVAKIVMEHVKVENHDEYDKGWHHAVESILISIRELEDK